MMEIGHLKRLEVNGCGVAALVAFGQGVADLVTAHIGAVEYVWVAHRERIVVGKVGPLE